VTGLSLSGLEKHPESLTSVSYLRGKWLFKISGITICIAYETAVLYQRKSK